MSDGRLYKVTGQDFFLSCPRCFFPHLFSSYFFPVSLSNFYLAVPMRGCLGKHSCMSSPFPIAILNGTCSLRALILFCGDMPAIKTKQNKHPHGSLGQLGQNEHYFSPTYSTQSYLHQPHLYQLARLIDILQMWACLVAQDYRFI